MAKAALYCAHRTSTAVSCAFCEQEGHLAIDDPSKLARYLQGGGYGSPNCAQPSHPPTHWHAEMCHEPGRGPSDFPHFALGGAARLSFTARIEGAHSDRAASASKKDGLAVPPPFLRPRVARAQKIIRPYPLPLHPSFSPTLSERA